MVNMVVKEFLIDELECDWKENEARYERPPEEKLAAMSYNIEEMGQIAPIVIGKPKDKSFKGRVKVGFCRYEAFVILNRRQRAAGVADNEVTKIKCIVEKEGDEEHRFDEQMSENYFRSDNSPMDVAQICKTLTEKFGKTQAEIADKLHFKSQGTVSGYLSLFKLDKNLQLQVHNGTISYTAALELLKAPPESRQALVDAHKDGNGKVKAKDLKASSGGGGGNPKPLTTASPRLPEGPPKGEDMVPRFVKGPTELHNLLQKWEKKAEKDSTFFSSEASLVLSRVLSWLKGKIDDEKFRTEMNKYVPEYNDILPENEEIE